MAIDEAKMVIVVRADLKMSKGKAAAQAAHAAVNCAFASKKKDSKTFDKWMDSGQRKVVLKVQDERQLFEIKAMADAAGLINNHRCRKDRDRTRFRDLYRNRTEYRFRSGQDHRRTVYAMISLRALAASTGSFWDTTAEITQIASAPASTTDLALSLLIPPIA